MNFAFTNIPTTPLPPPPPVNSNYESTFMGIAIHNISSSAGETGQGDATSSNVDLAAAVRQAASGILGTTVQLADLVRLFFFFFLAFSSSLSSSSFALRSPPTPLRPLRFPHRRRNNDTDD